MAGAVLGTLAAAATAIVSASLLRRWSVTYLIRHRAFATYCVIGDFAEIVDSLKCYLSVVVI